METVNKTPAKVRLFGLWYFAFLTIWNVFTTISVIVDYLSEVAITTLNKDTLNLISYALSVMMIFNTISACCAINTLMYFLKHKLVETFKNTFLEISSSFLSHLLFITILSSIFAGFGYVISHLLMFWYPNNTTLSVLDLFVLVPNTIMVLLSEIIIMVMMNHKLYRFILLTIQTDQFLSSDINKTLTNSITKQTNLISLLVITSLLLAATQIVLFIPYKYGGLLMYIILWSIVKVLLPFCVYLSFGFNTHQYKIFCKYSHKCCIFACNKLVGYNQRPKNILNYGSLDQISDCNKHDNVTQLLMLSSTHSIHCQGYDCNIIKRMCLLLKEHCKTNNIENYMNQQHYLLRRILDDFHHLLQFHDDNNTFHYIFNQIYHENHNNSIHCLSYRRNHRHRLDFDFDEIEEKQASDDIVSNIMDKIHSFYYHSYDTFSRKKTSMLSNGMYDTFQAKSKQDTVNKFNLTFDHENDGNMYSIGQRFQYEESKGEWTINSIYNCFKDELLNNKICSIANNKYCNEYKKCNEYINTDYVQKLQGRKKEKLCKKLLFSYILSLLIYCNCDQYQNEWSASFRRIQSNESNLSLKKRHSYFYYSSLYLRNLVEHFGESLVSDNNKNKKFYHGVSKLMYFIQTITRFNCPLSTSEECQVAYNFTNNTGMILELQYAFSIYPLKAKFFKCASFSDYVNEKECLFIGGIPIMIIMNIINVNNGEIYGKYINALNLINSLLNGTYTTNNNNNDQTVNDLCSELLSYQLSRSMHKNSEIPEYIETLLNKYCAHLKNIMIFWHHFECNNKIREIFCSGDKILFFDLKVILNLFPNIEQIEYFNHSLKHNKQNRNNQIKNIVEYVIECKQDINGSNLNCVVIHHQAKSTLNVEFDAILNDWSLEQNNTKIIIRTMPKNNTDRKMEFLYNHINLGFASKNLLSNLSLNIKM